MSSSEIVLYDFYKTLGVPEHLNEVVKGQEWLSSLEIFLYDFYKTLGLPEGPEHFSKVVEASECLASF